MCLPEALVDEPTDMLVSGYIRRFRAMFPMDIAYFDMPRPLCRICTSYYLILSLLADSTSVSLKSTRKEDGIKITQTRHNWDNAVYGKQWISSSQKHIIQWRFRCIRGIHRDNIGIGIVGNQHFQSTVRDPDAAHSYMYYGGGGRKHDGINYDGHDAKMIFQTDDRIKLILDLSARKIIIDKNDGAEIDELPDIKTGDNIKYRLVISLCQQEEAIELCMGTQDLLNVIPFCESETNLSCNAAFAPL